MQAHSRLLQKNVFCEKVFGKPLGEKLPVTTLSEKYLSPPWLKLLELFACTLMLPETFIMIF